MSLDHFSEMSEEELREYRAHVSELAADIPGTVANLSPEVQREYREAEQSVINARERSWDENGHRRIG